MNKHPLFLPHSYKVFLSWGLWTSSTSHTTNPDCKQLCPSSCTWEIWSLYKSIVSFFKKSNFCLQWLWILTATQTWAVLSFRWISLISFLCEFIYLTLVVEHFFIPAPLLSTANPKRLWRPQVGIDQLCLKKTT